MPWVRVVVELMAAGGASAVAIARLGQLGEFEQLWRSSRSSYTRWL